MESQKDNIPTDITEYIRTISNNVLRNMEDEFIKNVDGSRLTKQHAIDQLEVISRAESWLDVLLSQTEEIGGFGSFYPKKCLDLLKTMRTILQMEVDEQV